MRWQDARISIILKRPDAQLANIFINELQLQARVFNYYII